MIGMTKSEVKKYSAVDEMKNGCITSHVISEEEEEMPRHFSNE